MTVNYPGMREDVLEIFRNAQQVQRDHFRAIWARRNAARIELDREIYRQQVRDASRAPCIVGVSQCPLCGGAMQHRQGNPRPTHIGVCAR